MSAPRLVCSPGVHNVHDLHVWSIAGGMSALSAHVQIQGRPLSQCDSVLAGMVQVLQQRYARGEIDTPTFENMREQLVGSAARDDYR